MGIDVNKEIYLSDRASMSISEVYDRRSAIVLLDTSLMSGVNVHSLTSSIKAIVLYTFGNIVLKNTCLNKTDFSV